LQFFFFSTAHMGKKSAHKGAAPLRQPARNGDRECGQACSGSSGIIVIIISSSSEQQYYC